MPDDTVIDGEVIALDAAGKPSFNILQNYGSTTAPLHFFVFDLLRLNGRDVMDEPLVKRRELLEKRILPKLPEPVRYSPELKASLTDLIQSVKAQGLEGLVAKRRDSKYEPGLRSGVWQKMRVNQGQELVIAGYTPSPKNFDALVIGYFDSGKLIYAAHPKRIHAGIANATLQEDKATRDQGLSVCESTGEEGRALGRGAYGREDVRVPVAKARAGRPI
jgi:ATP-dependent DNA ligase